MAIQQLARTEVVTAETDTPVTELAERMREDNVGSIVVTDDDRPVGIVTDRDLTLRVLAVDADPEAHTAGDVMTTDLCTAGPGAGFYEATELMSEHGVRRLPVCDEENRLVGIVTADDMTELLAEENQHLASVVQAQRPPY
jgi:CBS domain-containing protein